MVFGQTIMSGPCLYVKGLLRSNVRTIIIILQIRRIWTLQAGLMFRLRLSVRCKMFRKLHYIFSDWQHMTSDEMAGCVFCTCKYQF